jgi:hypothetical protein
MTIELNEYGLMIDLGDLFYVSLSWASLISFAIVLVAYKAYNAYKRTRNTPHNDLMNSECGTTSNAWDE